MRVVLRTRDYDAPHGLSETVERQVLFALSRFRSHLRAVEVSVDRAAPSGAAGPAHRCRIRADVQLVGPVNVEVLDADCSKAIARAVERAGRQVRLELSLLRDGVFPGVVG
ncbi:MAG: hypothetical protein IT364_05885 [Candidatus Hydrogenedentes bacterium]|nr:hypothetical protein [Candidatus Hydrogenedentota bacterium]